MAALRYPSLYQINTRVWLTELSRTLGRPATLDDMPDAALDRLAEQGFDWVWFLSVWQTGPAAQRDLAHAIPSGAASSRRRCPTCAKRTSPARASRSPATRCIAISAATRPWPGCASGCTQRGLKLMLDFVPNHMGLDHPWVEEHPDYFIHGTETGPGPRAAELHPRRARNGHRCCWPTAAIRTSPAGPTPCSSTTATRDLQEAMIGELVRIAGQCDGVRCDMAMLVLPDVFERTWGIAAGLFWPKATERVRQQAPDFCFMAEVYWDLEWTLQQQGFDYAYDKRLYDRLREGHARPVREHFHAGLDYQDKLARFLENHDEPRAAATFSPEVHEAAAVITFLSPGLRFFHQGQFEGRRKRISPHLVRGPDEPIDQRLEQFYDGCLRVLRQPAVRDGQWQLLECTPAWDGNWTCDGFVVFAWQGAGGERLLVAVNYAPNQSQCYVRLPFADLGNGRWRLQDLIGDVTYDREGGDLQARGLYLDEPPWQCHAFTMAQLRD